MIAQIDLPCTLFLLVHVAFIRSPEIDFLCFPLLSFLNEETLPFMFMSHQQIFLATSVVQVVIVQGAQKLS